MPEMPEMHALSERLDTALRGAVLRQVDVLGFSGLKTVAPDPASLVGRRVEGVSRRGKYLVLEFDGGARVLVHLSQAGRLDVEQPVKATRPRGSVVRFAFSSPAAGEGVGADLAVLVREHGTQRKAGWWVLGRGDEGPLAELGVEATSDDLTAFLTASDSTRHLHTLLRDQRVVAGIGRGWADDICNRAGLSPFAALRSLDAAQRAVLVDAVRSVLDGALDLERGRSGGLSEAKLGGRFAVHNRSGQPCPRCGATLQRVSFESHEVVYCPPCQTKGRVLADRRLSRLLR